MCKKSKDKRKSTNTNQKSFWRFIGNEWTLTIGSFISTVFFSLFVAFYSGIENKTVFWFIIGIVAVLYIIFISYCIYGKSVLMKQSKNDLNNESEQAKLKAENELKQSTNINTCYMDIDMLLSSFIQARIFINSKLNLTPLFYDKNKVDSYRPFWQMICDNLHKLVKALSFNGKNFGVNIIVKLKDNERTSFYMPAARYTNKGNHSPLMTNTFIPDFNNADKSYHFLEFFNDNDKSIEILVDKKEIDAAFVNDDTVRNQYIALPIKYQKNTVALLQIIAYEDSAIFDIKNKYEDADKQSETDDFKKLKDNIEKYFRVYEQLVLLTYVLSLKATV